MVLKSKGFVLLILTCCYGELFAAKAGSKILSRRKRYVAFPEGSSFSAISYFQNLYGQNQEASPWMLTCFFKYNLRWAVGFDTINLTCAGCMTVGVIGQPAPTSVPGTFTWGMNWGIAYELPNATETARFYRRHNRLTRPMEQRRSRRELYGKLEKIMENMGYNGRQCILKTLCETTQRLVPHGENMVEEMFRTLFTLPMTKILASEPVEHAAYDAAHRLGHILSNCDQFTCPVSLVDLVQGYYNAPSPKLDTGLNPWALFSSSFG